MTGRQIHLGADPRSTGSCQPETMSAHRRTEASSRYVLYRGRYREQVRFTAIGVLAVLIAISEPAPSVHGKSLVILLSLVVTVLVQESWVFLPRWAPLLRNVTAAVAGGVLVGFDTSTAEVLLAFVGLDAAGTLSPASGVAITALAVVAEVVATVLAGHHLSEGLNGLAAIAGFLLGSTIRQYVLRAEEAELRLADFERAEIERDTAVRLAGRAEVAREIHDILAHNLGALVVQLDAVNALLEGEQPNLDGIRPVLLDAHRHAVDGLAEARQAVSSLREDSKPLADSLKQLVASVPGASLELEGPRREPAADISLVIRRIAQEALANAMKHAPGAETTVRLEYLPSVLCLVVSDPGRPAGVDPRPIVTTGGGYGIEGMKERAQMVGAALTAGSVGDGWRVELTVPDRNPS